MNNNIKNKNKTTKMIFINDNIEFYWKTIEQKRFIDRKVDNKRIKNKTKSLVNSLQQWESKRKRECKKIYQGG